MIESIKDNLGLTFFVDLVKQHKNYKGMKMTVDLTIISENKIDELAKLSLVFKKNDDDLMEIIRVHYKLWEKRLFPYCKLVGISQMDVIMEILQKGGIVVTDRKKLNTYLNRAKKEHGGK